MLLDTAQSRLDSCRKIYFYVKCNKDVYRSGECTANVLVYEKSANAEVHYIVRSLRVTIARHISLLVYKGAQMNHLLEANIRVIPLSQAFKPV